MKKLTVFIYLGLMGSGYAEQVPNSGTMSQDDVITTESTEKMVGENSISPVVPKVHSLPKAEEPLLDNVGNADSLPASSSQEEPKAPPVPMPVANAELKKMIDDAKMRDPVVNESAPPPSKRRRKVLPPMTVSDGVTIFSDHLQFVSDVSQGEMVSLPSASIALGTVLYGVEALPTDTRPLVVELNHLWLGANQAVLEMTGCRLWLDVKGDYTTERVAGLAKDMTCRSDDGTTFSVNLAGHMIDEHEEYLGAKGELVAKGKALASALTFLQDGTAAFGSAMSAAQVSSQMSNNGESGTTTSQNVSGDQNKYMAGKSLSASTAKFLNWWIDFYQSLQPVVAIASGKQVYIAIRGTIKVPRAFFMMRQRGVVAHYSALNTQSHLALTGAGQREKSE